MGHGGRIWLMLLSLILLHLSPWSAEVVVVAGKYFPVIDFNQTLKGRTTYLSYTASHDSHILPCHPILLGMYSLSLSHVLLCPAYQSCFSSILRKYFETRRSTSSKLHTTQTKMRAREMLHELEAFASFGRCRKTKHVEPVYAPLSRKRNVHRARNRPNPFYCFRPFS